MSVASVRKILASTASSAYRLLPGHRMSFPISRHRHRIDRVDRRPPPAAPPRAAHDLFRWPPESVGAVSVLGQQFNSAASPAASSLMRHWPLAGRAVDERNVVVALGPIDPAEHFQGMPLSRPIGHRTELEHAPH